MAKKTTLDDIAKILGTHGKEIRDLTASVAHVVKHMATKEDVAEVRRELKGDIVRVSEQVASIETQLRDMKHTKLHARVADVEEKIFGAARA